jgi:hypothetical protein
MYFLKSGPRKDSQGLVLLRVIAIYFL